MLGPLDGSDPEGDDIDDDPEDVDHDELESKLKGLEIKKDS